ncbi:MAG: hypothetical protein CXT73_04910 [Methanobacteriota archaeon]|nr:MAG: hypothetical protein CXT73_04910 [Euryarchaeota archaeon]
MVKNLISRSPKIVQKVLSNKYILYGVLVLSLINIVGYIQIKNWDALALYIMGQLIMSYFSKNMIVNTLVSLFLANCKVCADYINLNQESFIEGAKNRDGTKKKATKYYKKEDGNCVEHNEQTKKDGGCKGMGCKKNCVTCYDKIKCT